MNRIYGRTNQKAGMAAFALTTDGSRNRLGFLYAGGKYTTLNAPGSVNYTRAVGINDSNVVVGDPARINRIFRFQEAL